MQHNLNNFCSDRFGAHCWKSSGARRRHDNYVDTFHRTRSGLVRVELAHLIVSIATNAFIKSGDARFADPCVTIRDARLAARGVVLLLDVGFPEFP